MKKLCITICLLILLASSISVVIALYISGPHIKYDSEIQDQKNLIIQKNEEEIKSIERHVFRYITYIANTENEYIWYDSEGKELLRRTSEEIQFNDVKKQVEQDKELEKTTIYLGYGYEQGVYVIENEEYIILLDVDTREEVYYQRK